MSDTFQDGVDSPPRWLPAWMISFALHVGAVVLLMGIIERVPRGGLGHSDGTIEVVLNRTSGSHESAGGGASPADWSTATVTPPRDEPAANASASVAPHDEIGGAPAAHGRTNVETTAVEGGRYGPPGEGQASVRLFGVEGVGSTFVFVFDRSASMEGPPLAAAKSQLVACVRALKPVHRFHIIFFNHHLQHFRLPDSGGRIAFATDRNKQFAERFVGGITADGGTDRLPALRAAIALRPDVIFFLTDAADSMPASELDEIERLNRRVGATFSTIEFGRGPAAASNNFLTRLAQRTGGQYGYVDTLRLEP